MIKPSSQIEYSSIIWGYDGAHTHTYYIYIYIYIYIWIYLYKLSYSPITHGIGPSLILIFAIIGS